MWWVMSFLKYKGYFLTRQPSPCVVSENSPSLTKNPPRKFGRAFLSRREISHKKKKIVVFPEKGNLKSFRKVRRLNSCGRATAIYLWRTVCAREERLWRKEEPAVQSNSREEEEGDHVGACTCIAPVSLLDTGRTWWSLAGPTRSQRMSHFIFLSLFANIYQSFHKQHTISHIMQI